MSVSPAIQDMDRTTFEPGERVHDRLWPWRMGTVVSTVGSVVVDFYDPVSNESSRVAYDAIKIQWLSPGWRELASFGRREKRAAQR